MKDEIKYIEYLIKEKEKERVDACEEIDHYYCCEEITLLENILKELKTSDKAKALNIGGVSESIINDLRKRKRKNLTVLQKLSSKDEIDIMKGRTREIQTIISLISDKYSR